MKKFDRPQPHWQPYRIACLTGDRVTQRMLTLELEGIAAHIIRKGGRLRGSQFVEAKVSFETAKWFLISRDERREYEQWFHIFEGAKSDRFRFTFADKDTANFIENWISGAVERAKAYTDKLLSDSESKIYARIGQAAGTVFAEIPSDVLAHYVVEDVQKGTLVCPQTNERMFSVHIDPSPNDTSSAKASVIKASFRGLYDQDIPFLIEMKKLISDKKISMWMAAGELAAEAPGAGTPESKQRRLHRHYQKYVDDSDS
jgi:hypothetical protein